MSNLGTCILSSIPHGKDGTCVNFEEITQISPAPVEGVVLPVSTHTRQSALDEIQRISRELQTNFHDEWDWMEHAFAVECLRSELDVKDEDLAEAIAQRDYARLACSLNCDLHGCGSESCNLAAYHEDAQKMYAKLTEMEAALAAARAHGREEGLREAAEKMCILCRGLDGFEKQASIVSDYMHPEIYWHKLNNGRGYDKCEASPILALIPKK